MIEFKIAIPLLRRMVCGFIIAGRSFPIAVLATAGFDVRQTDPVEPEGGAMLPTQPPNTHSPAEKIRRPRIQPERRQDERTASLASVILVFDNHSLPGEFVSMTLNHSRNGMCLETAEFFEPRSRIRIQPFQGPPYGLCPDCRPHLQTARPAEVRWCREFPDESNLFFRIGVRYCR
jgi:hypothetical protein